MNKERYLKVKTQSFPLILSIAGVVFVIVGIVTVLNDNYKGIAPIVLGLIFAFTHMGFEIDFEKKLYKEYILIAVFKFGTWKSISDFDYVFVRKVELKDWRKYIVYKIFLKDRQRLQGIEIGCMKEEMDALEFGKYVAENLGFEIKIEVNSAY